MLQLVGGLILDKDKEDLVHSDFVPPVLKYTFYLGKSYYYSFKFSLAL
jgi:hypothetical protein